VIPLTATFERRPDGHSFVARLSDDANLPEVLRENEVLLLRGEQPVQGDGFRRVLRVGGTAHSDHEVSVPSTLDHLQDGDIVRINEAAGELRVLYRQGSHHNVLFFTERCNSRCLMCSQPPRDVDDEYLIDDMLESIPLMVADTHVLCITGGEPTILGWRLMEVMTTVAKHLPDTALHMLSNGRAFAYKETAKAMSRSGVRDLMIGIPLYADVASVHNFVVQAKNAFDQTIRGMMNLARFEVPVEIRFVIHRQTVGRLVQTARFIARNLPFASQVALMGLETIGFTRSNVAVLWIDPWEYREALAEAVSILDEAGMRVMIYNLPLCLMPQELWPFAQKSISDWKNMYMPVCESCAMKSECAGFFASATFKYSDHIRPLPAHSTPPAA
jgi:His-Xaa-Ser system radical SAM maturase HxsC